MHWANSVAAKLVTAAVFAGPVSVSLMLLAAVVGRVVLELARWVLGVIPFGGAGVAVWHW
jgi:hypothetical protein